MPVPALEGRQGAEAALVSRGTIFPLSPTKNTFPSGLELAMQTIYF